MGERVSDAAILDGALELLPETLPLLAIVLLQVCLVYRRCRYRRGVPGNGWTIAFESMPLNAVISPALSPGAGRNRTVNGLF
jgi:hypothetical protein